MIDIGFGAVTGIGDYTDGTYVGASFPDGELKVPVTPGRHTVRVRRLWFFSPKVTVDVPGQNSYVQLRADIPRNFVLLRILKGVIRPLHSLILEEIE